MERHRPRPPTSQRASNAAWSYPRPTPLARMIKGHVAFAPGTGGDRQRPTPLTVCFTAFRARDG
ncbi:DUF427 domain-containing protein [Arthrobacter sp. UYCu723]